MMTEQKIRILAASSTWQGATDYGFVRAFRRADHSVSVVSDAEFFSPGWDTPILRLLRRGLTPAIVASYERALVSAATAFNPHLFVAFKGTFVTKRAIEGIKKTGAVAINYYPDLSFTEHGSYLPAALPVYDWVFNTKSFGLADMSRAIGIENTSFIPHPYDPETHFPASLDDQDEVRYRCDVSFIGSWTPKKEALLSELRRRMPDLALKIWGNGWRAGLMEGTVMHEAVLGREYAKAISASTINIAILTEVRQGASSGDATTTRTFEIPAVGGFMLHERTEEAQGYFAEGRDCAMFADADEMIAKTQYYLAHPEERARIASAGHQRCAESRYSTDWPAATLVDKALAIRQSRQDRSSAFRHRGGDE